MTSEQIADLNFYKRSRHFSDQEKAVIRFADHVTRAATTIRDHDLKVLRDFFDDGQIVELTLAVCMANFTNRFNDTMDSTPDLGV